MMLPPVAGKKEKAIAYGPIYGEPGDKVHFSHALLHDWEVTLIHYTGEAVTTDAHIQMGERSFSSSEPFGSVALKATQEIAITFQFEKKGYWACTIWGYVSE